MPIRDDQPPMDPHENREWLVAELPKLEDQFKRAVALGTWWLFIGARRRGERA